LAQINSALAASNLLLQASNSIVQVQDAYYDLVYAWQNVGIQEQGLQQATAQAQSNARLAARGVVAPTDVVEAQTQVSVFQDNVFAAIQNVQRVQNELKSLILANPGDPVWLANLVPTTPIAQVPVQPALSDLITTAVSNRPEIAQLRAQREQADINVAYARNQIKPQVDLGLGYTSNGFAGSPLNPASNPLFALLGPILPPGALTNFTTPSFQTGGFGTAWNNLFNNRYPTYSAQLTLSVPIGNHTAKADYAIAEQQERNVAINETAVLQRIRTEAVNAIQGLRETQSRVVAARAAREAAERVLLGEERRFQAGTSTTFLVLQRQLEVANDRGRELQAQTDLDKAIVELQRVSGGIFQQNGVDVNQLGFTTLNEASPKSVLPASAVAPPVRRSPK
jgi:HAE1 family hydrophobic/amphiphilic exporter-1